MAARNLYVTAMEPQSGKSLVALGVMELLSGRVERLGFFRPIVASADEADAQIELVRRRYKLGADARDMYALTQDEASAMGDYEGLRTRVVEAYKALERDCDFVVCEGTDFTGAAPALDFGLNADLANELGAPVLVVVKAGSPANTAASVRVARDSLHHKGCTVFGVLVNRVAAGDVDEVGAMLASQDGAEPVYLIPEDAALACATVAETADALGATTLSGTPEALQREVRDVRVGAMSVEHFVENLVDGALVIVPGDRPDILVATLASTVSPTIPPSPASSSRAGTSSAKTSGGCWTARRSRCSRFRSSRTRPRRPSRPSGRCCARRTSAGSRGHSGCSKPTSTRASSNGGSRSSGRRA